MMKQKLLSKVICVSALIGASAMASSGGAPSGSKDFLNELVKAQKLKNGSLTGTLSGASKENQWVQLILNEIPERTGSFTGLLLRSDIKLKEAKKMSAALYVIDPVDATNSTGVYSMTPITTEGGYVGRFDDRPTLQLIISSDSLIVSLAGDARNDTVGFTQAMTFVYDSPFRLETERKCMESGVFGKCNPGEAPRIVIGADGMSAEITMDDKDLSLRGSYSLSASLPGLYTAKGFKLTQYGREDDNVPQALSGELQIVEQDKNDKKKYKKKESYVILLKLKNSGISSAMILQKLDADKVLK